jgi:membrane protein
MMPREQGANGSIQPLLLTADALIISPFRGRPVDKYMGLGMQQQLMRLNAFVWDDDLQGLSGLHKLLVFVLRVLHLLFRELMGGQLNLRAMSLVYTTLLSIVPLLAVSFSVLKGFGVHNKIEVLLYNVLTPLGPSGVEITDRIVSFVENVRVGVLGSIGLALLLYTVIALLQKIEAAFNFVWQIENLRALSQRFSSYLSVILIGPVLIFSAVGFTATVLNMDVAHRLKAIEPFGTLMLFGSMLVPYILVCLAFTLIYIFIPNTRVQFKAALIGGVIAGVIWKMTGWGFAAFIASSSKYAAIYSSFAIMILLLIWLYLSWLILLVGSQIAYFVQHPRYMTLHRDPVVLSNRMREQLALQIMYLVGYNHFHNKTAWNLDQFSEYLDLPGEPVHRIIRVLVDGGYLIEIINGDTPVYLPMHDTGTIRLIDVVTDIRAARESRIVSMQKLTSLKAVDAVMTSMDASRRSVLQEQTLRSLVESVDDELEAALLRMSE